MKALMAVSLALLCAACTSTDVASFADGMARATGAPKQKRWIESSVDIPVTRYNFGTIGCSEARDEISAKDFGTNRELSRFTGEKIDFIEKRYDPALKKDLNWNRCTITYRSRSYR